MEFSCSKKELLGTLQVLSKAVSSKPKMPILAGIFIKAENNMLHMEATDFEIGFITSIPADVADPGEIVISGKFLQDIVRKLPGDIAHFSLMDNVVLIKAQKTEFTLLSMNSADFPRIKLLDGKLNLTMRDNIFYNLVKKTTFSCSTDESRPIFCGCLFDVSDNKLTMAATNTHRLSEKTEIFPDSIGNAKAIIPAKSLNELLHIIDPDNPGELRISLSENHISFSLKNIYFTSRLIEGIFPEYEKVIPKKFNLRAIINVDEFAEAIDRISLISRAGEYNTINLLFEKNMLHIHSNTPEIGKAEETISAELEFKKDGSISDDNTKPDSLSISFNAAYISDVLKAIDTEKCIFSLIKSLDPALVREDGDSSFVYVVTPVRTGTW